MAMTGKYHLYLPGYNYNTYPMVLTRSDLSRMTTQIKKVFEDANYICESTFDEEILIKFVPPQNWTMESLLDSLIASLPSWPIYFKQEVEDAVIGAGYHPFNRV